MVLKVTQGRLHTVALYPRKKARDTMPQETIVLYSDTARELKSTRKTVEKYVRKGLLARALLPGFKRARGITRKSLDALLDQIANAPVRTTEGVRQ